MSEPKPSEAVKNSAGHQYHINLAPGELAPYVLICGDPARAKRTAGYFDSVRLERANREYVTFTGQYAGVDVSVIGTGIGADNTEIMFVEAIQLYAETRPTIIRVGSSGSIQPDIQVGDLVISTGSVRLENTSTSYVAEGYPALADHEVILALISAADRMNAPFHVGLTASTSGFFAAQGRAVAGLTPRFPEIAQQLADWNVLNMEMEGSTLFTLGNLTKVRTGMVCAIYANRVSGQVIGDDEKHQAEEMAIRTGLEAVRILSEIDGWKARHEKKHLTIQLGEQST